MSVEAPEPTPYPWLTPTDVQAWLQLDPGDALASVAELCRKAAADYCQDQRRDLFVTDEQTGVSTFTPTDRVVQAGLLATARLYARRSSPAGLASYGEFGAAEVLRLDPDVERLLGIGRYARPVVA